MLKVKLSQVVSSTDEYHKTCKYELLTPSELADSPYVSFSTSKKIGSFSFFEYFFCGRRVKHWSPSHPSTENAAVGRGG